MSDLLYKIALTQIPGIGSVLAKNLISYCGGVEEIFNAKYSKLIKIPGIGSLLAKSILNHKSSETYLPFVNHINSKGIKPYFFLDEDYPYRLRNIADCPILIYAKSSCDLSPERSIAIVGTRKITNYGKSFIKQLISDIQSYNPVVFSGMAYGVDIYAHKECIKNGLRTVGVLAHGLDRLYPSLHAKIADQMCLERGGLITEFTIGTMPDRENFPKRNRIIAGMSDVVIVVESALKGGSLITAELANQYNRDVMAVPGDITKTYSQGCNFLIKKNKAHVIESAEDLVNLMNWDLPKVKSFQKPLFVDLDSSEQDVLAIIKSVDEIGVDQLMANSSLSPGNLASALLSLEMKNCITSLPGKRYQAN